MRLRSWLSAGALICAVSAGAQTVKNAEDPAAARSAAPASEATQEKKGHPRGKPRRPRVSRKHVEEKLRQQKAAVK